MKKFFTLISMVSLGACQSITSTTAYPGLNHGDPIQKVLEVVGKNDRIVEKSELKVVAYGKWDLLGDCRKKTFVIYENQGLQEVRYEPAPELSIENNCAPKNL